MTALIVLGVVVVLLLIWAVAVYNSLVAQRNMVKNAWAQIDVQLKRRHDLIPNLVEVVKDYMDYEQETLRQVVEARGKALDASSVQETAAAENQLTGALKSLFAVVESYPELKANENVRELQEELTSTENRIAFARQYYNDSVMRFNTRIQQFPANLVAGSLGFTEQPHYETPAEERENVAVDLR
jgi:LemA protein